MRKATLFIAALMSLASAAGCRRVVILNFVAAQDLPNPDRIYVEGIQPKKSQQQLSGLGQTLGYFDVSTTSIEVRVTACMGSQLLSDHQENHAVIDDEVTIPIDDRIDADWMTRPACPKGLATIDGGSNDSGAGGESGGMGGSGLGGAGGDVIGGVGGAAAGGSGAGGSGAGGAGVGGATGTDGGAGDAAECGTDTHGPVCEPPSGDAGTVPDPPPISAECMQYCSNVRNVCGATVYDSDDSCQRYCAQAGWTATGSNSLECRNMYLVGTTRVSCLNAGPSGGSSSGCGIPCLNFCTALIGICHLDPSTASACMTACSAKAVATSGADPACRFQLLQRALYDSRYCDYVKYDGSCFSCN